MLYKSPVMIYFDIIDTNTESNYEMYIIIYLTRNRINSLITQLRTIEVSHWNT
jgi:hypothetical protein